MHMFALAARCSLDILVPKVRYFSTSSCIARSTCKKTGDQADSYGYLRDIHMHRLESICIGLITSFLDVLIPARGRTLTLTFADVYLPGNR
jgi:hypothetical protein